MTVDLTCRELVELVTDYLDGALGPGDGERFVSHLAACEGCAVYLEQARHTLAALGSLRCEPIDPDAREALLAVFRGWRRIRGLATR